jgi:endonuclease YncB( thermonuclease family)
VSFFNLKKILFFATITLALLGCFLILGNLIQSEIPNKNYSVNTEPVLNKNNKAADTEIKPVGDFAKVIRVIDGDTIEIEGGERVRYIGMNTPETVDPRKPVQCFGVEASNENKELVEGKTVRLEKDISERDKYGRLLRYVFIGDIFINLELVKRGFAYADTIPPDIKYQDLFLKAQQSARSAKIGLWRVCPLK